MTRERPANGLLRLPPTEHRLGSAFEIPEQRRDGREQLLR